VKGGKTKLHENEGGKGWGKKQSERKSGETEGWYLRENSQPTTVGGPEGHCLVKRRQEKGPREKKRADDLTWKTEKNKKTGAEKILKTSGGWVWHQQSSRSDR